MEIMAEGFKCEVARGKAVTGVEEGIEGKGKQTKKSAIFLITLRGEELRQPAEGIC